MTMKRIPTILLLTLLPVLLFAQGRINLVDFSPAPKDQTANEHGTEVIDQNGYRCALIRIATTEKGFSFEGGSLGIRRVDDNHTGEIWVYVPAGLRRITIHHALLGHLYDWEFPVTLERGHTYRVQLVTGKVNTVVEEDVGGQFLVMKVSPTNATVYVDDRMQTVKSDGTVSVMLPYGRHTYRVEAASYVPEAGAVEIGQQKQNLNVNLKIAKATLTVSCTMADAQIFINDEFKGNGSCQIPLDAGLYVVETRKAGHRTRKQSVSLAEQEQKNLAMPEPEPMYGTLSVNSDPVEAEVWLDGKKLGNAPDIFRNILAGNHDLELRKQGYKTQNREVKITESKVENVEVVLQETAKYGKIHVFTNPSLADVWVDGTKMITTPSSVDGLSAGKHKLKMQKSGYKNESRTVTVTGGKTEYGDVTLVKKKDLISNVRFGVRGVFGFFDYSIDKEHQGGVDYDLNKYDDDEWYWVPGIRADLTFGKKITFGVSVPLYYYASTISSGANIIISAPSSWLFAEIGVVYNNKLGSVLSWGIGFSQKNEKVYCNLEMLWPTLSNKNEGASGMGCCVGIGYWF